MTDYLTTALTISLIALFSLLLWALSIAFVLRDVNRRDLPGYEQIAWLVLAAVLPLIGGIAYLFARLLDRLFSPAAAKKPESEKRVTAHKNRGNLVRRLPTIAAVDTFRETLPKPSPIRHVGTARSERANLYLEILSGPAASVTYPVRKLPIRIGRGPTAGFNLDADQGVSRQHAEIYENDGQLRVRDLNSTHGTFINGKRISDESLNPGDQLAVGLSTMVLLEEDLDARS